MNVEEKLSVFSQVVMDQAEERRKQIIKEMEKELDRACKRAEEEAREKSESMIRQEKYRADQLINKEYLHASSDSRKELADLKNKLTGKLFQNLEKRLENFVTTDEYGDYLAREISRFADKHPDDELEVLVMHRDLKFSDKIKLQLSGIDEDFIGGFKIILKNKNAFHNGTFLSKLDEERENFNLFRSIQ